MEDSRGGQDVKLNRLELNMYESSYDCVPRVSYDSEHNHIKPMTFSDFQVKNEEWFWDLSCRLPVNMQIKILQLIFSGKEWSLKILGALNE